LYGFTDGFQSGEVDDAIDIAGLNHPANALDVTNISFENLNRARRNTKYSVDGKRGAVTVVVDCNAAASARRERAYHMRADVPGASRDKYLAHDINGA
jgi:hypothetical protein